MKRVRSPQMSRRSLWGILCVLVACEPLPPEPKQSGQTPEFTVLTAKRPIGSLDFSLDAAGHLEGALVLERDIITPHPLRIAAVWTVLRVETAVYTLSKPILRQADQQLIGTFLPTAGTQTVSGDLPLPPDVVRGGSCAASANAVLVLFVDVNENGVLDLTSDAAIDHVLSSSDFPRVIFGDQRLQRTLFFNGCGEPAFVGFETTHQPVYDDPLLDLVSCTREARFEDPRVCGSSIITNAIWFRGDRHDDDVTIYLLTHTQVTVIIDGQTRGLAIPETGAFPFSQSELGTGQHAVHGENVDGTVWEATFTFPDRTWIRSARSVGANKYEIDFQEINGATIYSLSDSGQVVGAVRGTSSPLQVQAMSSVTVTAQFGELPFVCTASAEVGR